MYFLLISYFYENKKFYNQKPERLFYIIIADEKHKVYIEGILNFTINKEKKISFCI